MAGGMEVVVRRVVFPNIRPASARVLPPLNDPSQGFCTLGGSGGSMMTQSYSWNSSNSKTQPQIETKRQFDKEKVYQVDDVNKIVHENFIFVERMKKVRTDNNEGAQKYIFQDPPRLPNVETKETDVVRDTALAPGLPPGGD